MKLFLSNISPIIEAIQSSPKILDEIDAIANTIDSNMNKEVSIPKDVLDSFKLKDNLNEEIWINNTLNPKVRKNLIKIAMDFFKDLELSSDVKIKDIIFTGSLANFNWSKFSDIDLHIVLDFNQFEADPKFVENYFYAQKSIWNQEHDINVFGYPVELYVQDTNANLVATAVYSVLNDKWLKKPSREQFELDKKAIKDKANKIIYNLRDIRQDYNDHQYQAVVNKVKKLKDKIKQMRNAGLERGGEFSLENLVFKTLRRTPFMDVLDSFKAKAYDKLMSVSETSEVMDEELITKPSPQEIKHLMFTGEGFFDFNNANAFAERFMGIKLVKQIGSGGNGAAYLTNKGTKLKFTFNENEYHFAKRSIGRKTTYMADYYSADEIAEDLYVIEMEYLKPLTPKTKAELKQMFDALLNKDDNYNKPLKTQVDNIKSKIGMYGNDLGNYDNYGIKNGQLATFDPVSEEVIDEGEVLDNSKFKYKRENSNKVLISAYYNNDKIAELSLSFVINGYDFVADDGVSKEEYIQMFPQDKFALIGNLEILNHRYKGVAKELMKRAIAKSKQQGFDKMYLNAIPMGSKGLSLANLVGFYKSFGFKEIKQKPSEVAMYMNLDSVLDEVKELPYNPKPEMKAASAYSSLSNPTNKVDIDKIKFKMAKANQTAIDFNKSHPNDHYFYTPTSGDGFYQVEITHDGQIRTKHVRASGDMEQRNGAFQPSDLGTCKNYQNIAKYCFVAAGKNRKAIGASPAEDAANKALIIFRDEILDFLADGGYNDGKGEEISNSKMSDKEALHKKKKDLETQLGRRLSDSEWNHFLDTGIIPKTKSSHLIDPEKAASFEKRQAELQAKIEALKARRKK